MSIGLIIFLFFIQIIPPLWTNDVTSLRHFLIALFVLVSSVWLLVVAFRKKTSLYNPLHFFPFKIWTVLVVLMFISMIWAINFKEALVVANRWLLILLTSFFVTTILCNRAKFFRVMVYSAMAVALINIVTCLCSYFYLDCADFPNKIPMINGGYGNKNIFAVCLMFKLPFLYYVLFKYNRIWKTISAILITGVCFCLPIISTRSAFVCLVLNMLILFLYSFSYLLEFKKFTYIWKSVLCVVLLIGGFALGSYFVTINYKHGTHKQENAFDVTQRIKETGTGKSSKVRIGIWKNTLQIAKDRPILGYGAGNHKIAIMKVETAQKKNFVVSDHAHNDFLEMLSELGLVGLLLYISLFASVICLGIRIILYRRTKEPYRLMALISIMLIFTYINDAMFNFPNERASVQIYLALAIAIMGFCYYEYKKTRKIYEHNYVPSKKLSIGTMCTIAVLVLPCTFIEAMHCYSSKLQYDRIICYNNNNKYGIDPSYWQNHFPPIPDIDESTRPIAISVGNMYALAGNYRQAIDVVLHDNSNPYLGIKEHTLAIWYAKIGKNDSCLYFADKSLKMKPKNYGAVQTKMNLYNKLGRKDKTLQVLEQYAGDHPLNYKPWRDIIDFYIKEDNLSKAKLTLDKALQILPKDSHLLKKKDYIDSCLNTTCITRQ